MVNLSRLKVFDLSELVHSRRFIYFLFNEGRLFYIGVTVSIRDRLKSHRIYGKAFDKVLFQEVTVKDCYNVEDSLIHILKPVGNKTSLTRHRYFLRTWTEKRMIKLLNKYFK